MKSASLRRSLHMATAAVLLLVPLGSWTVLRAVLLVGTALAVVLEMVRLRSFRLRNWMVRVAPVFRPEEAGRPSGAMWLAVGYGIAALFPPPAPAMGILIGAIADPVASWAGSAGTATQGKTLRGSAGHFVIALGLLVPAGLPWGRAAVAAAVGTVLERWSGPLNDNVVVAPGVAAAVTLLV